MGVQIYINTKNTNIGRFGGNVIDHDHDESAQGSMRVFETSILSLRIYRIYVCPRQDLGCCNCCRTPDNFDLCARDGIQDRSA